MADEVQTLRARLQLLELQQAKLKREKDAAESEFGQQRSKFRDILMKRESELAQHQGAQQNLVGQYQHDVNELRGKLQAAVSEAQSFQQMATVLESSGKEELDGLRRRHDDEVTSLRCILDGSSCGNTQQGREHWLVERQQLEAEITRLRSLSTVSSDSPGSVSATAAAATSSSSSRSTLLPSLLKRGAPEDVSTVSCQAQSSKDAEPAVPASAASSLEMRQLKERLRESRTKVKNLQRQLDIVTKVPENKRNGLFGLFSTSSSSSASATTPTTAAVDFSTLSGDLRNLQKCSRQDLEMFLSALMAEKDVLQEENSDLRSQLDGSRFERGQSVQSGDSSLVGVVTDLLNLESPPPNHSQLSLMPLSTSASVSQPLQPSAANSTTTNTTSTTLDSPQLGLAGARQGNPFAALELAPFSEQSMPSERLCSAVSSSHSTRRTMSNDSALLLGLAEGGLDTQRRSSSAQDVHEMSFQPIAATTSASSLEALSQGSGQSGTVSAGRQSSADPFSCSAPASRHSPVTVPCHSCAQLRARLDQSALNLSSAESKIEMVESQLAVRECKREDLQATVDKLTFDLEQERATRQEHEAKYGAVSEDLGFRLESLDAERADAATMLEELRQSFALLKDDAEAQVAQVGEECDKVKFQLISANDTSSRREVVLSQELDKYRTMLETERKAHSGTMDHRKALQEEIESRAHAEDQLRAEVQMLQSRLQTESFAKESVEMGLQSQLQDAHMEIAQLRSAMDHENTLKQQTMAGATAAESQWKTGQLQSQETITVMERRLQEQQTAKTALEQRVAEQKYQLEQLRSQLNTSEETSHDFVRLSQNLQVRLAQLTAQQREVRWEHEDDVTECRTCQKKFVPGMKKHHCRQCGKIYCSDCSSKTVTRAPGTRPLRVCSPCYSNITTETPVVLASDASALESSASHLLS